MEKYKMKNILFDGNSDTSNKIFGKMLAGLESPMRYRFSRPEKLVRASGIKPGECVLEIGCGSGFFTPTIADMVGDNGQVRAIDLHPVAVAETEAKVNELGLTNVSVTQADAEDTGFPAESFDRVLLYGVVPSPVISVERLTGEIHRLLKPAGILAVWTIAPFWSAQSVTQLGNFYYLDKISGVHQFAKMAGRE
jgi:demethylmenaquinone methyltransferase/2-methoxy-6-polyprenyl-1,4-benzoquinol methylase